MPEIDGWKLCRLIRSREFEPYNDIPILATSAVFAGEEAESLTAGLGANALLAAPFTAAELVGCVNELLHGNAPNICSKVLIMPPPGGSFRGLVSAFRRCGYETLEEPPEQAGRYLDVSRPDVAIVWEGHPAGSLDKLLQRSWEATSPCVSIVVLDEDSPTGQLTWLKSGADACVRMPLEPDYLVNLAEKLSRVRAMLRIQDLLEQRSEELRASQETFQLLFEGIPDAVVVYGRSGTILGINENGARQLESYPSNLVGRKIWDLLISEEVTSSLNAGWTDGKPCSYNAICASCSGVSFEVEVHQRPIRFRGEPATLVVIKDVTEELVARQAVRMSETKCKIIADNTYDWEFWRSPQGHFLYSSPACKRISGYDPFEFEMDVNFLQRIVHPEDASLIPDSDDSESDESIETEFRIVDKNGNTRWVAYMSRPVYDERGNLLGTRGAIRDLTHHKEIENERERLVAAIEQCAERIAITDLEGRLEYVNPAFERAMGPDEGYRLGSVYTLFDDPEIQLAIQGATVWTGRRCTVDEAGRHHTREVTLSPVRDRSDILRNFAWVERDVTSELELQERLLQAQRMEAIGTLAGGVAHDFNNLLSGILGYSSLLKSGPTCQEETVHAANVIETAARRAADLTQKLLGFARQGKHQHEPFSVHDAVAEVLTLLSRTTDRKILSEGLLGCGKSLDSW